MYQQIEFQLSESQEQSARLVIRAFTFYCRKYPQARILGWSFSEPVGPLQIDLQYEQHVIQVVVQTCPNGAVSAEVWYPDGLGTILPTMVRAVVKMEVSKWKRHPPDVKQE